MLDERALNRVMRSFDLSRRSREAELKNQLAITRNASVVNGLGRSSVAIQGHQKVLHEELIASADDLWTAMRSQFSFAQLSSEELDCVVEVYREQLSSVAADFNASIQKAADSMGLHDVGNRCLLDDDLGLLLEKFELEMETLSARSLGSLERDSGAASSERHLSGDPPTVLFSYAWGDPDAPIDWVVPLATRLREDGVNLLLDMWETRPGDQLPEFMECAVRDSEFVLFVCTPKYRARCDERAGGVGYEGHIITGEVFAGAKDRKFIPILRGEQWQGSAPSWAKGKGYIDLRGEPYSEDEYQRLLDTLLGSLEGPPPVGSPEGETRRKNMAPAVEFELVPPVWKSSSFLNDNDVLATIEPETCPFDVPWLNSPQAFIRLSPKRGAHREPWTPKELVELMATDGANLHPPGRGYKGGGVWRLRNRYGAVVINAAHVKETGKADRVSQVFNNGVIWTIDRWLLRDRDLGRPAMGSKTVEEIFTYTLANTLRFAEHALNVVPPLELVCGLSAVEGYSLVVSGSRLAGHIVEDEVVFRHVIESFDESPAAVLRPFFVKVWEAAGLDYPR